MKKTYPQGNKELLSMMEKRAVNIERAESIIASLEDVNAPIMDMYGCSTTYLCEAVRNICVDAVRLLLRYGADPNANPPDLDYDCALWELAFISPEDNTPDAYSAAYEIAKLLFSAGAKPTLLIEGEVESLYDHVVYSLYNYEVIEGQMPYYLALYKLMIAYGTEDGNVYSLPKLEAKIDLSRIDDYQIRLFRSDDGYHVEGHMYDPKGNDIGRL